MSNLNYRPDIDGLRAIAVLSVVLYHMEETFLSGGFVGVDIFFVISGYLITKLIYKERSETGAFSYSNFYLRRVRRLFPALFVTLLFSLLVSAQLFSPADLVDLGKSLVAAVFSVSNLYFWSSVSYFDNDSALKPLLHTWSLSVEEQFYFLWPFILVSLLCFSKRISIPIFIVLMGLASLLLNVWFFSDQANIVNFFGTEENEPVLDIQSTSFYWLPFRLFEFSLGAILIWIKTPVAFKKVPVNELIFLVGIGLIGSAIFLFSSEMDYLSTLNVVPCLGAALIILSGPKHRLQWLISNSCLVWVGLVSYSLYLIHWPLIVFYKYWHFTKLEKLDYVIIALLSFLFSWLMFRYVETPFRKPKPRLKNKTPNRPFLLSAAVATLLIIGVAAQAIASKGWLWRYPDAVLAQLQYQKGDYSDYFWKNIHALDDQPFQDDTINQGKKIVVMGDSMAADFINVLYAAGVTDKINLSAMKVGHHCKTLFPFDDAQYKKLYGSAKDICRKEHERLMNSPSVKQADTIVLASYWDLSRTHLIEMTAAYLRENTSADVLVLGLKDQETDGMRFLHKHSFSAQIHQLRTPLHLKATVINNRVKAQSKSYFYIDLLELFCNDAGCQRATPEGYIIIFDNVHLSERGAEFVAQKFESVTWYSRLLYKQ